MFDVLLLISSAWFAFRARRDLWFVVLADLAVLASAGPRLVPDAQRFSLTAPRLAGVVFALGVLAGVCAFAHDLSPAGLERRVAKAFPVAAARAAARAGCPGPLYND